MPPNSSSLKKQNQEFKAQIDVLSDEINNLKMQLSVNAGDGETAAAAQFRSYKRSPTMEHSDFQPVQTHADVELKQLSTRLNQVRESRRGREGN